MSTNPGVTSRPSASSSRVPRPSTLPTSVTTSPAIATSAVRAGAPEPSTTVPPRITRSCSAISAPSGAHGGQDFLDEERARGARVVAVGPEARPGDHEAVDAERVQLGEALDDGGRWTHDRE